MELDKRIEKKAAVSQEGTVVKVLGYGKYDVRLKSGAFLKRIIGSDNLATGDYVLLTKNGNTWNILQKTYNSGGSATEVKV